MEICRRDWRVIPTSRDVVAHLVQTRLRGRRAILEQFIALSNLSIRVESLVEDVLSVVMGDFDELGPIASRRHSRDISD
jgi:hypothetical protein